MSKSSKLSISSKLIWSKLLLSKQTNRKDNVVCLSERASTCEKSVSFSDSERPLASSSSSDAQKSSAKTSRQSTCVVRIDIATIHKYNEQLSPTILKIPNFEEKKYILGKGKMTKAEVSKQTNISVNSSSFHIINNRELITFVLDDDMFFKNAFDFVCLIPRYGMCDMNVENMFDKVQNRHNLSLAQKNQLNHQRKMIAKEFCFLCVSHDENNLPNMYNFFFVVSKHRKASMIESLFFEEATTTKYDHMFGERKYCNSDEIRCMRVENNALRTLGCFAKRIYRKTSEPHLSKLMYEPSIYGDLLTFVVNMNLFDDRQTLEIVLKHAAFQILCVLDILHEKNIVHRDVKPENILVHDFADSSNNSDNQIRIWVKLTDFENAGDLTKVALSYYNDRGKKKCGTIDYASPDYMSRTMEEYYQSIEAEFNQKIETRQDYDPRQTDIYALGVSMAVLYCGINGPLKNAHYRTMNASLNSFVNSCCDIFPSKRKSASQILWKSLWLKDVREYYVRKSVYPRSNERNTRRYIRKMKKRDGILCIRQYFAQMQEEFDTELKINDFFEKRLYIEKCLNNIY